MSKPKPKFNVGDKVVIRKHKLPEELYDLVGQVYTIKRVDTSFYYPMLDPMYYFEEPTPRLIGNMWVWSEESLRKVGPFEVSQVIYDKPFTTVYWLDGTRTTVRCHKDDEFSEEVGLAMAIVKKAHGNTSKYIDTFKKFAIDKREEG